MIIASFRVLDPTNCKTGDLLLMKAFLKLSGCEVSRSIQPRMWLFEEVSVQYC